MNKIYFLALSALLCMPGMNPVTAQKLVEKTLVPAYFNAPSPVICYYTTEDMHSAVPLREELERRVAGRLNENEGATIIVDYFNFNPDQRTAFQYAADIWGSLLQSDVPIRIQVSISTTMPSGTLASAGPGGVYINYDNFQNVNTWYGTPLAEKIAGEQLNAPEDPDIVMRFNNNINFYTGLDLNPGSGQYDFVSIALHEMAHGLGFTSFSNVTDNEASYVFGAPSPYDRNLENSIGENIHDTFSTNVTLFANELTSNNVRFNSFSFEGGTLPRIYAPLEYNGGSSISHLNESTYPAETINSLMTPQLGASEAIHDPGIALKMLEDMGWISMDIDHVALLDTEDQINSRQIVASAGGDNPVIADGVKLHYTYTNWSNEVVVPMSPTGTPNEYSAEIPATLNEEVVSYYLTVEDSEGRVFTKPGEAPEYFLQYTVGPDNLAPIVRHTAAVVVLVDDPVVDIAATVEDNLGAGPLTMTYKVNGGAETDIDIPIVFSEVDGVYFAEHLLEWDLGPANLEAGDLVEYRLSVTDNSMAGNITTRPNNPAEFYQVRVEALAPPQTFYVTDFTDAVDDFSGEGFNIETPSGFATPALHSNHPYRVGAGADPDDTLELQQTLKVPIILSEANATIRFDEIVLVEPGETGAGFGTDEFWDYVVVEGSLDFGTTWSAFEDGYDSRADATWLSTYNGNLQTITIGDTQYQDSKAVGNESLYRPREIDMLKSGSFAPGQQVLIRFKVYADQLAAGWGWAIDNLRIQVDDAPPMITHIPIDYAVEGDNQLGILAKITDNGVLDSVVFEINIDGQSELISVDEEVDLYEINLNLASVSASTSIRYRIIAVDSALTPNTTFLPATGFFEIPVVELGEVKTMYVNDFSSAVNDFISTNYEVDTYTGFADGALHSPHPHSNAPTGTVSMSTILKYPIKLSGSHSWMSFKEVGLVDASSDGLTVEVSNNNGVNWYQAIDKYGASADAAWNAAFFPKDSEGNSTGVGTANLYRQRLFDLQSPTEINKDDEVLVRFTMLMNDNKYGWGWAIDDVEIQGPTTAIDEKQMVDFDLYPNPTSDGRIAIQGSLAGNVGYVLVTDILGQAIYQEDLSLSNGQFNQTLDLSGLKKGIYLVSVRSNTAVQSTRVVVE